MRFIGNKESIVEQIDSFIDSKIRGGNVHNVHSRRDSLREAYLLTCLSCFGKDPATVSVDIQYPPTPFFRL